MTNQAFNTEKLQNRDYVLVLDKSGSMDTADCPRGVSRWKYAQETVQAISHRLNEYDPDGITVIPFAGNHQTYENTKDAVVEKIFAENYPAGGTVLAPVLKEIFANYLTAKKAGSTKANGEIVMIVTDGCPQDEEDVAKEITKFTQNLSDGREEFGIVFVQVGKDSHARDYLKRLDSGLSGAKYDIVSVKTMDDMNDGKVSLSDALVSALTE